MAMQTVTAATREMGSLLGVSGIKRYDVDYLIILKEANLARKCFFGTASSGVFEP